MSHNKLQRGTLGEKDREDQVGKLRTSGKWISTVTQVYFTMLEYIVHVLRLYKARDASKVVAMKLCGSSFLLGPRIWALDHACLVCATSLQVWDCRFIYDMLCFSRCVLVRVSFIYSSVCGYGTIDIKLSNFVVQVLV